MIHDTILHSLAEHIVFDKTIFENIILKLISLGKGTSNLRRILFCVSKSKLMVC